MYRQLRKASFLVVRVQQWCWPKMSPYLPLCIRFLHFMPNGRKNNGRTHLFFERGQRTTVDNSDFEQFKTETYVYWRFNMIIRKLNAVVRSFKEKDYLM